MLLDQRNRISMESMDGRERLAWMAIGEGGGVKRCRLLWQNVVSTYSSRNNISVDSSNWLDELFGT